jgi:Na+/H+ antiporter NhaD/arsenite permease-like protein
MLCRALFGWVSSRTWESSAEDLSRTLANYGGRVERVELSAMPLWAGRKSALLAFFYGIDEHETAYTSLAWLRTQGPDVRTQFRSLMRVAQLRAVLSAVPWDVLVILVSLGALSEVIASSRLFDVLAVRAARASDGDPRKILLVFAAGMYVVSGVVNTLTALLLVLPVQLVLLRLVGADQRFVRWSLGTLLVCCNLGGAATLIGDFPAILLLARGRMSFGTYLSLALPVTAAACAITLAAVHMLVRPTRNLASDPLSRALTVATVTVLTSVLTAVFSAGPSMAALLDVAESLATSLPPATVYVGLALAVCAGSSLFLTAATAGPLAQAIVESAGLRDAQRNPLRFDFRAHLAPGLLGYAITLGAAFAFLFASLSR